MTTSIRRRVTAVATASSMVASVLLTAGPASADDLPVPTVLAGDIALFGRSLDGLGQLDELDEQLPMAGRSVREVLQLDAVLGATLAQPALDGPTTASELAASLDAATLDAGTVGVEIGDVAVTEPASPDDPWQVQFSATVQADVVLPLQFVETRILDADTLPSGVELPGGVDDLDDDVEELVFGLTGRLAADESGGVLVTATLDTGIVHLEWFDSATAPAGETGGLSVVSDAAGALPAVAITLDGRSSAIDLPAIYGFADVTVGGTVGWTRGWTLEVTDPDGHGVLEPLEWSGTLPADLFAVSTTAGEPTDTVALTLDSPLVPGTSDGTIDLVGSDVELTVGPDLGRFLNITADAALSGLNLFTATLSAIQNRGNGIVPFSDLVLTDGFDPARDLNTALVEQASAVVTCGKTDTDPPSGENLLTDTWYCRAYTSSPVDGATVAWTAGNGTVTSPAGTAGSVGIDPSVNVVVEVTTPGERPDVRVTWDEPTADGGASHAARLRARTAGELAGVLGDALGLSVTPAYDTAAQALRFPLAGVFDPDAATGEVAVGDALRNGARLNGLSGTQDVSLDVSSATLGIDYGISLVDDLASLRADDAAGAGDVGGVDEGDLIARVSDRFLVVGRDDAAEFTIDSGVVTYPATATMTGKVGYLDVAVESTDLAAVTAGSTVATAEIGDDVTAAGVDQALFLNDVVADGGSATFTGAVDLTTTGTLAIQPAAAVADESIAVTGLAGATVGVSWDADRPEPTVTASSLDAAWEALAAFDLSPQLTGTNTQPPADPAEAVLVDPSRDFLTELGGASAVGDVVAAQLINTTTGGTCDLVAVLSATSLGCVGATGATTGDTTAAVALAGGREIAADGSVVLDTDGEAVTDNGFNAGDGYLLVGDPQAFGVLLVENLIRTIDVVGSPSDGSLDLALPVIGIAPRDLVPQLSDARSALSDVLTDLQRTGDQTATAGDVPTSVQTLGQGIAEALATATGASGEVPVTFTVESLGSPSGPHLAVRVGSLDAAGTNDTDGDGTPDADVHDEVADVATIALTIPANTDPFLDDDAVLQFDGTPSEAGVVLDWSSSARLDIAIPLDDEDVDEILVLPTTGITTAEVAVDGDEVDATAAFGALDVIIGGSAAITGQHTAFSGTADNETATGVVQSTVAGTHDVSASFVTYVHDPKKVAIADATELPDTGLPGTGTLVRSAGGECPASIETRDVSVTTGANPTTVQRTFVECTGGGSLSGDNAFADGETFEYRFAASGTSFVDRSGGWTPTTAPADGVIINTTDGSTCPVGARTVLTPGDPDATPVPTEDVYGTIACEGAGLAGGTDDTFDSGDTVEIVADGDTLLDTAGDFLTRGVAAGTTIDKLSATGTVLSSCTVAADATVSATEVDCSLAASGTDALWLPGDDYALNVTAALVHDPTWDFQVLGVGSGQNLLKGSDSCAITGATGPVVTCDVSAGVTFAVGDDYEIEPAAFLHAAVIYTLLSSSASPTLLGSGGASSPFGATLAGTTTGDGDQDCGNGVDGDVGCARLDVKRTGPDGEPLGQVTWSLDTIGGEPSATVPAAMVEALIAEPLDVALLNYGLYELSNLLERRLDGAFSGAAVPLAGEDLDLGADIPTSVLGLSAEIDGDEIEAALAADPPVTGESAATELAARIQPVIAQAVTDAGLMTLAAAVVTPVCQGTCTNKTVADVKDLNVTVTVGANVVVDPTDQSFGVGEGCTGCGAETGTVEADLGLPGLLLDLGDDTTPDLATTVGWTAALDFGLSRADGPYIGTDAADAEIAVGGAISVPTQTCEASKPTADLSKVARVGTDVTLFDTIAAGDGLIPQIEQVTGPGDFSDRCVNGRIGLFDATFFDGTTATTDDAATWLPTATDGDHQVTHADVLTTVDLEPVGTGGDRIGIVDLLGRADSSDVTVTGDANIDLYFVGFVESPTSSKLPRTLGTLNVVWDSASGADGGYTAIEYRNLVMDVSSFYNNFLGDTLRVIQKPLTPIKTVLDVLYTPIPGLSYIGEIIGEGPITIVSIAQDFKADKFDLELAVKVLDFLRWAATIAQIADGQYIGIGPSTANRTGLSRSGGFKTNYDEVKSGTCGATTTQQDGKVASRDSATCTTTKGTRTFDPLDSISYSSGKSRVKQLSDCPTDPAYGTPQCSGKELTRKISTSTSGGLTGTAISFPFLSDTSEVYGMLLGDDATLIFADFGKLSIGFTAGMSFGPFMIGPVPLELSIGFSVTAAARLQLGWDTRGVRLAAEGQAADFNDGFFISDVDIYGTDVDEITLTLTVTAGVALSVKVFKIGLELGVSFILGLNLNDWDGDGKLYGPELAQLAQNPLCIFTFTGTIKVFLQTFLEIDLVIWSKKWTWPIFSTSWQLFEVSCAPPTPVLAEVISGDLHLNIGTRASSRGIATDEVDERFTVRQTGETTDTTTGVTTRTVEVTAFSITQEFSFTGDVVANASGGKDVVRLVPGDEDGTSVVPFTAGSDIDMGAGDDTVETGDGVDLLDGGDGRDTMRGGAGDDVVNGGPGADRLQGEQGDDRLNGDAGDDTLEGGPGADTLDGGADDDEVQGGPGLSENLAKLVALRELPDAADAGDRPAFALSLQDLADVLIGGPGDDTISGHLGDDKLFGDSVGEGLDATARDAFIATLHAATVADLVTVCAANDGGGTPGGDELAGERGADLVLGGGGDDRMSGGNGPDGLCGQAGADEVDGDTAAGTLVADDHILGGAGPDVLRGGGGADTIDGGTGDDLVDGGTGDDDLTGGTGADAIEGGTGGDLVTGDDGGSAGGGSAARCARTVNLQSGYVDTNGDGAIGAGDVGRAGGVAVISGQLDLDRDGSITDADTGAVGGVAVLRGRVDLDLDGAATDWGTWSVSVWIGSDDGDCIWGDDGSDVIAAGGGGDIVDGGDGGDDISGQSGADDLRGGLGDDTIDGGAGADRIRGDSGDDAIDGGTGDDDVQGGLDADRLWGGPDDDTVDGGAGPDHVFGGSPVAGTSDGSDTVRGSAGDDVLLGDNGTVDDVGVLTVHDRDVVGGTAPALGAGAGDLLTGGRGDDLVLGQVGDDTAHGDGPDVPTADAGDDEVRGNAGDDTLFGGPGDDLVTGGSRASGHVDGDDIIDADAGDDLVLGDNGALIRSTWSVLRYDDATVSDAEDDAVSGDDTITAGSGQDDVHAGGGDDTVDGGPDADRLQGNAGSDVVHGGSGPDVILGGSTTNGVVDENVDGVGDSLDGESGDDVILGDNGTVTGGGLVVRYDDATTGDEQDDVTSGDDSIVGGQGDDVVRAGGGADTVHADGAAGESVLDGDDDVQGNAGADDLFGRGGDDLLVGGSDVGGVVDENVGGRGDAIDAGAGDDVVFGDNARPAEAGDDVTATWSGTGYTRLDDAVAADADDDLTSGDDTIVGRAGADTIRGGGGDDLIAGDEPVDATAGTDPDEVQGNAGSDTITGGGGDDLLIGGSDLAGVVDEDTLDVDLSNTGLENDRIDGGPGDDLVLGDNGTVVGGVVVLHDVATTTTPVDAVFSGDDVITTGDGQDDVFGQGGDDHVAAGGDDDEVEGNAGDDTILGGGGRDELVGGGSAADGVIDADRAGDTLLDGKDTIDGGDGGDVIAGDNARIELGTVAGDPWDDHDVTLHDVEIEGASAVSADVHGGDELSGDGGEDRVFGQGGDDAVFGGLGDDELEGNHADDTVLGGGGRDDILGGGSAADGVIDVDRDGSGLLDGDDVLVGDDELDGSTGANDASDTILGDNGRILRSAGWVGISDQALSLGRTVVMVDETDTATSGSDTILGNGGDDDLYGQFDGETLLIGDRAGDVSTVGDRLDGGDGDDLILGDQGTVETVLAGTLGAQDVIAPRSPFVSETVFITDSLVHVTTLSQLDIGGADVAFGGPGDDDLHLGAGDDLGNGGTGDDALFGAGGSDVLWGGEHRDHLFGGFGADWLDVKPRVGFDGFDDDPAIWFVVAPAVDSDGIAATTNGRDITYGGWDQDAAQADEGDNGQVAGDRLIDWAGMYNAYYVCNGAQGGSIVTREESPGLDDFLETLAAADGAVDVTTTGASGAAELAYVPRSGIRRNSNPVHPDTPGHFVCETG